MNKLVTGRAISKIAHPRSGKGLYPSSQLRGSNLLNSLVEWWPLAEKTSTRLGAHANLNVADTGGVAGTDGIGSLASLFAKASSQKLTRVSDSNTQIGNIPFSVCGWVNPTTATVSFGIIGKWQADFEWLLYYDHGGNRWNFGVSSVASPSGGQAGFIAANTYGAITTGAWVFLYGQYDGATVKISVNGGTLDSTAYANGSHAGTSVLTLGQTNNAGEYLDGKAQRIGLWKRILTADEIAYLYNGGRGRDYPFI